MRIAIIDACEGMKITENVYNKNGKVLLSAGTCLTQDAIRKLKRLGVLTIEVESDEKTPPVVITPQRQSMDMISNDIRMEAEQTVKHIWEEVKHGGRIHVTQAKGMVEKILDELLKRRYAVSKLADIRALDDYTFTHSVNVCVLSLSLGISLDFSEADLLDLGTGSLLHDLGKTIIPPEVLNKPGPLDEHEITIVRKHPAHGFRLLCMEPEIRTSSALIAYEHHERYLGNGYPRGLTKNEIREFSQLVSIIDVYDALTSDRVYRSRISSYEAVEMIVAMSGRDFNPKYVKLFLENAEIYPVGSVVELNNNTLAVVTAVDKDLPIRPQVTVLEREGEHFVRSDEVIELMKNPTIFITRIISLDQGMAVKDWIDTGDGRQK